MPGIPVLDIPGWIRRISMQVTRGCGIPEYN
jgi:hypothetical protein